MIFHKMNFFLPDIDLSTILHSLPGYVYLKNADSIYMGCNQNTAILVGLSSPAEIVGRSEYEMPWALARPEVVAHNIKADRYVIETGQKIITEDVLGVINATGRFITLRSEKCPLLDKAGKIVGVLGISIDITDEKNSEQLTMDPDFILNALPGYVYWKNLSSVYLGGNQNIGTVAGYKTGSEIAGKTDYELPWGRAIPEIATKYQEDDQYVITTGKNLVVEDNFVVKNEQKIPITVRTEKIPLKDKQGHIVGVLGVAMDISAQKEAESSELDMNFMMQSVPGYVYWKNLDSVYIGCNENMLTLTGIKTQNEFIGKTDYELSWGVGNPEIAVKFRKDDKYVITTGNSLVAEDYLRIQDAQGRSVSIVRTEKKPLKDKKGDIVGVLGIAVDITDQKEAERLNIENERHKAQELEQEKFQQRAHQVAHDIRSPLTSLSMLAQHCTDLPETERIALREATARIHDIAGNLLAHYSKDRAAHVSDAQDEDAPPKPLLVSADLMQILTEKRYEYYNSNVKFHDIFEPGSHFGFIQAEPAAFKRMISNLINNAVEALENRTGDISLLLDLNDDSVHIAIQDNGKGMSSAVMKKILNNIAVTAGKKDGHGLGFSQINETLAKNNGKLTLESKIGQGTTISLTFPKISAPSWVATEIALTPEDILLVLDDDPSIHKAWDLRLEATLKENPKIQVKHFEEGQKCLDFLDALPPQERKKVFLLSDYELLNQPMDGLDVLSKAKTLRSVLVTSHYANPLVLKKAAEVGTKILPKLLVPPVPITILAEGSFSTENQPSVLENQEKIVDLVLLDDDKFLAKNLMTYILKNHKVDTYHWPQELFEDVEIYHKNTLFLIDYEYKGLSMTGIDVAEQLHNSGFTNLYLYSGYAFAHDKLPSYLKYILKTNLNALKELLAVKK